MALGSTQPLTKMSKGGQCVGLTTLPHSCVDGHEIWKPQPPGTLRASPDFYRNCCIMNAYGLLVLSTFFVGGT